ncbi:hypothetical protein A2332_04985 [Candidatus Uhrbacteria bacterium RIFOXYB2_FULL_41_18]|nr:MAG: hypothetical protein A2332_04985 [Candidatus Uhrbacteria bacterium RIFOXYB2_FULL_41_18]
MNHEEQKRHTSFEVWREKHGHEHPIQVSSTIDRLIKEKGLSFADAYEFVCEREKVLIRRGKTYVEALLDFLKHQKQALCQTR